MAILAVFAFLCLLPAVWAAAGADQAGSTRGSSLFRTEAAGAPGRHLVVLGDPHIPGKHLSLKRRVLKRVAGWPDVEGIVAVGDLCADNGTDVETAAARDFFKGLAKPFYPIAGNHDVLYEDLPDAQGKSVRASAATIERKLDRFRKSFGIPDTHYRLTIEGYLLVFLSTDRPDALAGIAQPQLAWLNEILQANRQMPTVIFFHAPLTGTLRSYNGYANTFHFTAQPAVAIHDLLREHRQVFLWVSGHMHTTPQEESFASPVNLYDERVMNIHVPDMNRSTIWTVSLFLQPGSVVVRTYDHRQDRWVRELDRTVPAPSGAARRGEAPGLENLGR